MLHRVLLTLDAVNDLEELDTWISTHDSPERADYVLDRISEVFQELAKLPERGTYPKELSALGIREFREVFFKPYRIIYRVEHRAVYIYLIADGRRDMQTLLSRRLLTD
jgi:toxin ParE1/3/4